MGPKTEELIIVLDQLVILLDSDKQIHWHEWVFRARTWIANSDYSGIEYLLSAYGGMGSINDIVIGRYLINNQFSYQADYVKLNEDFSRLKSRAYELALAIKYAQS
jgi:hypothetical protein